MKERPIPFTSPMVRAILAGAKTQTRRVVKDQPPPNCSFLTQAKTGQYPDNRARWGWTDGATVDYSWHPWIGDEPAWQTCPYGQPGDRLWVREAVERYPIPNLLTGEPTNDYGGRYVADGEPVLTQKPDIPGFDIRWWYSRNTCPPIHMPRWASRITLEITEVRVQRLQEISEEDAKAEGFGPRSARALFCGMWDTIHGNGAWRANPWIWALSLRVLDAAERL
jgi:hypothetical protein